MRCGARWPGWVFGAAWLGVGVYVYADASDYLRAPTGRAFAPLVQAIEADWQSGDVIVFEPEWMFGYATDQGKLRRFNVQKTLDAAMRAPGVTAIWLVSPYRMPTLDLLLLDHGFEVARIQQAERFHIAVLRRRE